MAHSMPLAAPTEEVSEGNESAVLHKEPEWPHIMGYLSLILTMPEVEDCPQTRYLSSTISFLSSPPVPSSCL